MQVFSWTSIGNTHWLAILLWQCSLLASIAALISSAQQRLLNMLPSSTNCLDSDVRRALKLVLHELPAKRVKQESSSGDEKAPYVSQVTICRRYRSSKRIVFFWQHSLMLMSWSWVFFLSAFTIHIATPLIQHKEWSTQSTVSFILRAICKANISQGFSNWSDIWCQHVYQFPV